MQETWVQSLGGEDPLEKEMATHSGILGWRILQTEETGRLQSMESQEFDMIQQLIYKQLLLQTVRGFWDTHILNGQDSLISVLKMNTNI